ncbi:MAG TPA: non-canonical purine NTP pyrophosphatase, RdgB/HAM1 family [Clostridiales bacterium]|nr:non-canonical purine NTP pyrophosphatase, RdgB/HAM1 family [Clostridiales bacterium]
MKTIVFATNNHHKVTEVAGFFEKHFPGKLIIKTLAQIGFSDEIIENTETFEGNALQKAKTVSKACGLTVIADDSGLEVDYLNGMPGVYSARYAGEGCSSQDNINKLLSELEGVPMEKRTARFVSVICACLLNEEVIYAKGCCEGVILTSKRGTGDFGYDPVFYYPPLQKSFAELDLDTKNGISHRGIALRQFVSLFDISKA